MQQSTFDNNASDSCNKVEDLEKEVVECTAASRKREALIEELQAKFEKQDNKYEQLK